MSAAKKEAKRVTLKASRRPMAPGAMVETYGVSYQGHWPTKQFDRGEIWVKVLEDKEHTGGLIGATGAGGGDRGAIFEGRSDEWAMPNYRFTLQVQTWRVDASGNRKLSTRRNVKIRPIGTPIQQRKAAEHKSSMERSILFGRSN